MNIPKQVKVGGHTIKVICPYKFQERRDLRGQYDHDMKEIRLSVVDGCGVERDEGGIFQTFLHELFHAIDFTCGHEIFTDNEKALEGITEGLYQVLVDNEGIFDGKA